MFGKKGRLTVLMTFLIVVILLLCSCSGIIEVFVQIVNEYTGTIFFSVFNSTGQGIKIYSGVAMQPGGTRKVTLDFAEGYYLNFSRVNGELIYLWNEEIGGEDIHDFPWVNSKTYFIGDPLKGHWECISSESRP